MTRMTVFLRWALLGDAVASGGTALLLIFAATALQSLLGIDSGLLSTAGFVLLPYAAVVGYLGARDFVPRWAVWGVIAVNVLWAIDSFALLMGDSLQPTVLGQAFVIAQAIVVLVFAELQFLALRRVRAAQQA